MRLLPILLLYSYSLLGSASQAPTINADCNDQNIFEAVDEALRSYNNGKEEGNQFVLYRITDAKIKIEGDGQTNYFVEHEIHEGSCGVKSGKTWQECAFLAYNAEWGKCSAHVVANKVKLRSVVSQKCSRINGPVPVEPPVTAVHHQCLGCPHPIDTNNENVLRFVHSSIEKLNTEGTHPFYFDLENIVNATLQVVNGWNYNIIYLVRQTNCMKTNFTSNNFKECNIEKNGESGKCNVQVFVTPNGQVGEIDLECTSETGVCLNCPVTVDRKDPELLNLLSQVMDEYNSNSNHTELYRFLDVEDAKRMGFHEQLYDVTFMIKSTNCSKPHYIILGDECDFLPAAPLSCSTKINVTDKMINVRSAPKCEQKMIIVRIGGFSPFRGAQQKRHYEIVQNDIVRLSKSIQELQESRAKRHGHKNKEQKHGRKGKKDKRKHKQDHEDDDSSEESADNANGSSVLEVTQNVGTSHQVPVHPSNLPITQLLPEAPKNQGASPNTDETSVLDLPEQPSVVSSRCPGKLWQPVSLIPEIPTVKTFTIEDLASAIDDLTPLSHQDIEKNEPVNPKQIPIFNDEDLLG